MGRIVYDNDRQIRQAEITHVRIDAPFVLSEYYPQVVDWSGRQCQRPLL